MSEKHTPLLPCPFCGGAAKIDDESGLDAFWGECIECGADADIAETAEEAATAWNMRAHDPSWSELLKAAKACLAPDGGFYCTTENERNLRAAIAKATGND